MRRRMLALGLLLFPAALALAALPCKTKEEAMAEAVTGFFTVQRIGAERCDALLGGDALMALHRQIETRYGQHISGARATRTAYFQRAYGERAQQELARVEALMTDLFNSTLSIDETSCGQLKEALAKRLAAGWEPIEQRLQRRVQGVASLDQNVCEE